jgi:hypothetical protein
VGPDPKKIFTDSATLVRKCREIHRAEKKPERINAFVFVLHILRGGILAGLLIVETLLG